MEVRRLLRKHGDLLLAGAVGVAYVVELLLWGPADKLEAVPLALVAAGFLALRRRVPLAAFLLVMTANYAVLHFAPGFDANSISFVVVFLVALYSLGRHARGLEAWLGVVAVAVEVAVFVIGDGHHRASDILFALAVVGMPWAMGLAFRLRREREVVLTARNEELRAAQEENERRAVTAERARIARELHDVVSHAISVTVLQARGARKLIGRDDEAVRGALDAIEQTNAGALGDMRRLLAVLRDTDTEPEARQAPQPSLACLDTLLDQVRASGLDVTLSSSGSNGAVPAGVDLSAYRIVQEALTNVIKHAGPSASASVTVRYGDDTLDVAVTDTGGPRDPAQAQGTGHGLVGIRERVAVVGGTVEARPAEEGGFVVRAHLPYANTP